MAKRPPSLLTSSSTEVEPTRDQRVVDDVDWPSGPIEDGFPTSESPAVGYEPRIDRTLAGEHVPLAPKRSSAPAFDGVLDAEPAVADDGPPLSKRAARLLVCVAFLAAGGFAVSVGTDGILPSLFDRSDDTAVAQRVEVAAAPTTTVVARSPITRTVPRMRQLLAMPDGGSGMDALFLDGSQDGLSDGAGTDGDEDSAPTEPTEWVEPDLGPTGEWVDSGNGVLVPDLQLRIRFCESTNNYAAANVGSSARGAYQFLVGSWDWYGHAAITGVTEAHLATPAQQDEAALRTLQAEGARPWAESRPCWGNPDIDPRYATAKPPTPTPAPTTTSPSTTEQTTEPNSDTTTETTVESTTSSEQPESTDTTSPTSTETTVESTTSSEQPEPTEPTESTDTTTSSSTDNSEG